MQWQPRTCYYFRLQTNTEQVVDLVNVIAEQLREECILLGWLIVH